MAAADLVRREFTANGPNEIWTADITYFPTGAGFLYLAVVIDVWSRRIVGWSMRDDMTTPLVTDALDMAITTRRPDRVFHHSDPNHPVRPQTENSPRSYERWSVSPRYNGCHHL